MTQKQSNQDDAYRRHIELLGFRGKDKVTGFSGVVDTVGFDAYGCIQLSLKPPMCADGTIPQGYWFDVTRIVVDFSERVVEMPNFHKGYVAEGRKGAAEKPSQGRV